MKNHITFAVSLLFFWLKGSIAVDSRFVNINTYNTIFGCIPAGKNQESIPLKNISSAKISSRYNYVPLTLGIILILKSFSTIGNSFFGGVFLLAIGLIVFSSGVLTVLTIQRAGNNVHVSVPLFEKAKLAHARKEIDLGLYFDKK